MSVTPSGQIVPDVVKVNANGGDPKKKLSFAVFGDPHVYSSRPDRPGFEGFEKYQRSRMYWPTDMAFREMVEAINQAEPDIVFGLGDMADFADRPEMELYMSLARGFAMPLYNTLGNHDLSLLETNADGEGRWRELKAREWGEAIELWKELKAFSERYYSFSRQGHHFTVCDHGVRDDLDDEQFQWLEADLMSHRGVPTFLFCHRPLSHVPFIRIFQEQGRELTSGAMYKFATPRREFFDLISRHGAVQMVFSGSVHFNSECRIENTIQRTLSGAFDGSFVLVECY